MHLRKTVTGPQDRLNYPGQIPPLITLLRFDESSQGDEISPCLKAPANEPRETNHDRQNAATRPEQSTQAW